jgi:hypothetical protein
MHRYDNVTLSPLVLQSTSGLRVTLSYLLSALNIYKNEIQMKGFGSEIFLALCLPPKITESLILKSKDYFITQLHEKGGLCGIVSTSKRSCG